MPLSEQEQRLLDEMERNLYQNDADFVATVGVRRERTSSRAVLLGVLVGLAGVIILIVGVSIHLPIIGVLGFLVMFGGVLIAVTPPRARKLGTKTAASPVGKPGGKVAGKSGRRSSGFMDSLNDRWERRQEDRDN